MGTPRASLPALALTAALGVGFGVLGTRLADGDARQCPQADGPVLEARIGEREAERARRPAAFASPAVSVPAAAPRDGLGRYADAQGPYGFQNRPDADQLLKDLLTLAWNDRRSFAEKLDDFLAEHPGRDGIAIASKGVFDLGDNRDVLSDSALESLYLDQQDPALKRVLAQVASMRGDNGLIELHIAQAAAGLRSNVPAERQQALVELSRTRHVAAADLAAPLLRDPDTGVVLDALLALRATGNQRHVRLAERLLDHPDESVRWLAMDVVTDLQMLSDQARTRIADNELAAELPPLPLPPAAGPSRCSPAAG
ncbi:hypothetical protein FQY83_11935 [Luteimonas marina]|uniref:HEAT repeat domain-containing protein n=1 Tax=Luteimonas marina TaxID=488485 RepID=A0A5C5TZ59_9GAMM|nr:hypothetical protein [Luteimonas marina]TWT19074.1 hypothetical protein FQY83_11935 [Luteimonas marina]